MLTSISIIIPFYYGNKYLNRLISNIEKVEKKTSNIAKYEVILVNDSPDVDVKLPQTYLDIKIIRNNTNMGIQGARVNGLINAKNEWILFLDQDDELIGDGFIYQIMLTPYADVVVGNGQYCLGNVNKRVYGSLATMKFLVNLKKFIEIRNLIPSPGECLIKRTIIPELWKNNKLSISGADDWFLWLLLFDRGARFICNEKLVYVHNDTAGMNLSADLQRMKESSMEMLQILRKENIFGKKECKKLKKSIEFKYYQDTKQLKFLHIIKYIQPIWNNVLYKIGIFFNNRKKEK